MLMLRYHISALKAQWGLWVSALAICGALPLFGCGSGNETIPTASQGVDGVPAKPPGPLTVSSGAQAKKRVEPEVTPLPGPPPQELIVKNLIKGSGPKAKPGDELSVHFAAIRVNGEAFESIWSKPFTFELGPKDVNPGFVKGLPGMRVGGRRELIVPTKMTSRYSIPPAENFPENSLIYVVDLLNVTS